MAQVRIVDLPENLAVNPNQFIATDLTVTQKATIQQVVDAGVPVATESEARAGTNNSKRMTPLTTLQSIGENAASPEQGDRADSAYNLTSPVVLDSTTLSAALKSRFDDIFPLTGYVDASFDNMSTPVDNHDAFSSILTEAQGRRFVLPRGNSYIGSDLPVGGNGKPFSMDGNTGLGTLVFSSSCTRGLRVEQPDYVTPVWFTDMTVLTLGQENGIAISVILPAPDNNKPINDPRTAFFGRTIVKGWNNNQHGWAKGAYTENCHSIPVERFSAFGRQNTLLTTMARFTNMTHGFHAEYTGASSFIGGAPRMTYPTIVGSQIGVLVNGRSEGGAFASPYIEAVWDGIDIVNPDTSDRPGFEIHDGHINSVRRGIYFKDISNSTIGNVQFFKFEYASTDGGIPTATGIDSVGETVHVVLNGCDTVSVLPNIFNLGAGTPSANGENTGIRLLDSTGCNVHESQGIYVTTGVSIKGSSIRNRISGPKLDGDFSSVSRPTKSVRNEATTTPDTNIVRGPLVASQTSTNSSTSVVAVSGSFSEVIRLELGRCEAGEVWDVAIAIEVTKGATAGLTLFQLIASEGGASFNGKGAVLSRFNQASSNTDVGNESSMMSVSSSGNKTLILQALAQGSTGTINSGSVTITALRR